ncbi:MAG: archease [Thermoplasmatota archaeon]
MHRLLAHTADVQIEAEGASREEALAEAALALGEVVTGRPASHRLRPDREVTFVVEAPDLGALAVAFLAELLWILESQDTLWLEGGVRIATIAEPPAASGLRLTASGNGALYDPVRHGRGTEVKAVTYHALEFAPIKAGWRLCVVLDI